MHLNINSILSKISNDVVALFVILLIPLTFFAIKGNSLNSTNALAAPLTPPITPPITPTPTPTVAPTPTPILCPVLLDPIYGSAHNPTTNSLQLSWYDNSTEEDSYELWRGTVSGSETYQRTITFMFVQPSDRGVRSTTDNDLESGTTYYYKVRAKRDAKGGCPEIYSNFLSLSGTTLPTATPTPTVVPTPTPTQTPTLTPTPTPVVKSMTLNISAGSNDAWQTADVNKTVTTNSTSIKLGWYAGVSGFRFTGASLADLKNKTVTKASLILTSLNNTNSPITLRVFAQNSGSCSTFNATQNNIGSRPTSQSSAVWSPANWTINRSYNSPDIQSLLNEVVKRADFNGQSICILVQNYGSAKYSERLVGAKEGSLPSAKLTINYQ